MLYNNYHEALSDEYLYTEDHSSYHEALSDGYLHIEDHDSRLDLARHFDGYLHIAKNTADTKWYVHLLGMYCSLFDLTTRNEEGIGQLLSIKERVVQLVEFLNFLENVILSTVYPKTRHQNDSWRLKVNIILGKYAWKITGKSFRDGIYNPEFSVDSNSNLKDTASSYHICLPPYQQSKLNI